jgi:hypothetical protein
MAEADSTPPSDVASNLVNQLEAEAAFVDAGSFTLDSRKAREKLAAYRFAEPERFVLFLVEAAHLLPNCMGIVFTIDRWSTKVVLRGVELRRHELQGCLGSLFLDVAGLDPERARTIRGHQRLGLAVNAALGLPGARVEMVSRITGDNSLRAVFDNDGDVQMHPHPSTSMMSALIVEVRRARGGRERALLRRNAVYATVPVELDGIRIDKDARAEILAPVEIHDAAGQVIGRAGWCAAQAKRGLASIAFVANGVVVQTQDAPELPVGALARLDVSELQRDLSQTKLQRDELFFQRVDAVSRTALSQPVPTLGPGPREVAGMAFGLFLLVTGIGLFVFGLGTWSMSRFDSAVFLPLLLILAMSSAFVYFSIQGIHLAHRSRQVRMHGHAGLGLIQSSSTKSKYKGSHRLSLDMLIERPGQTNYITVFQLTVPQGSEAVVEPGKRMYVRIDPNDPDFLVFDPGE